MPRTQPKESEENERNKGKTKPLPKESNIRGFSPSLGSWVLLPEFVGLPPEYVGFIAWVHGFMGSPLGSWVRRFATRFAARFTTWVCGCYFNLLLIVVSALIYCLCLCFCCFRGRRGRPEEEERFLISWFSFVELEC